MSDTSWIRPGAKCFYRGEPAIVSLVDGPYVYLVGDDRSHGWKSYDAITPAPTPHPWQYTPPTEPGLYAAQAKAGEPRACLLSDWGDDGPLWVEFMSNEADGRVDEEQFKDYRWQRIPIPDGREPWEGQ